MRLLIGCPYHPDADLNRDLKVLQGALESKSNRITITHDWLSVLGYVAVHKYSAIWMDFSLIDKYYSEFHRKLYKLNPHVPLIIMFKGSKIDKKLCLTNNLIYSVVRYNHLNENIDNLIKSLQVYQKLLKELPKSTLSLLEPRGFGPFIGNSLGMLDNYRQIAKASASDFTILILGASGSGKELVAKAIHELSPRANKNFVALNCAAIPENLLESELFGYEKGAFTDARQTKIGKFELADQGTLFLDEIGDMSTNLQAKLLRVINDHLVERLGGISSKKVDFRLLAATHQNLNVLINEGKFRSDLYHRLNVIPIRLKPLFQREDDILLLTLHILGNLFRKNVANIQSVSWGFLERVRNLHLEGNVRELENLLARAVFHTQGADLNEKVLSEVLVDQDMLVLDNRASDTFEQGISALWQVEKNAIAEALEKLNHNLSEVARQLEISRTSLYRKIKKYNLSKSDTE